MIDLYFWTTPNGYKPLILLEELALPYHIVPVNIGVGEQFTPNFLAIAPNNRIPAIVDHDPPDQKGPLSLFESGAILEYLATKNNHFLPSSLRPRYKALQWLHWQMGGLGPMAGQNHHFGHYAPQKITYAIDRYVKETARLYAVMNKQLADSEFLAGDYSIADMACYPWVVPHQRQQQNLDDFPHLKRWFEAIGNRSAVLAAYACGKTINTKQTVTDASKAILFGQDASTIKG
ncbi:MAG TPA: thiol:disulfide oxidoreductase [Gammaproteobacteria bacterium]|nr:thiol:disulfide oxidoreductase [Gammaproteobacteria bacterium]